MVRYIIKPRPHPSGFALHVEDTQNNLVYRINSRVTYQQRYLIKLPDDSLLEIKPILLGTTRRYKLLENGAELLSIHQGSSSGEFFLRDSKRKIIAHFIPITSMKILLRSTTSVVARISLLEYPPPRGFHIICDVNNNNQWVYAVLMYTVASIDKAITQHVSSSNNINQP